MQPSEQRDLHDALWRSHGGFDLVLAPVLLGLVGLWLDTQLGCRPLLTLVLLTLGAVGATLKVYYDWRRGIDAATAAAASARSEAARLREEARRLAAAEDDERVGS